MDRRQTVNFAHTSIALARYSIKSHYLNLINSVSKLLQGHKEKNTSYECWDPKAGG